LAFRNLLTFDLNKLPGMEVKGLLILQKIGDSYIFIHPMLREHFAQMDIDAFIQWADTRKA